MINHKLITIPHRSHCNFRLGQTAQLVSDTKERGQALGVREGGLRLQLSEGAAVQED